MSDTKEKPTILLTGASGGLASLLARMLKDHYHLIGADLRPMREGRRFPGQFHVVDYRQRKMADIFRHQKFHALLHLGRVPLESGAPTHHRFNLNVLGTRNLLELSLKYGTGSIVVVSSFHVYGAHQHNHLHITEEDPLRASQLFPELVDAVELDNVSTAFMLRYRELRTVVLRPVNVIGPAVRNRITRFLRNPACPYLLGYDPLQQFIAEKDFARAIWLALNGKKGGVYNVAGEGVVPFTRAIELAGSTPIPVPHFLAYPTAGVVTRLGVSFPRHLIDYFRFPTIVSDAAFRADFGYEPTVSTVQALASLRRKGA